MAEVKVVVRTINQDGRKVADYNQKLGDMVSTVGKLTAGVVAAGAVFKKAFDLSQEGANLNQLESSFVDLNDKILKTPGLLEAMREASRGTITDAQLMEGVLKLVAGTSDELGQAFANAAPRLLEIAKASNKLNPALGDTAFLYESISTGIKRQSSLILDNLGIVVKVGEANEKYAAAIGKSVRELNAEDRQMALLNATMESGNRLIEQVGGNVDSQADAWARLTVQFQNASNAGKQAFAERNIGTIEGLANTTDALAESTEKGNSAWVNAAIVLNELQRTFDPMGAQYNDFFINQVKVTDATEDYTVTLADAIKEAESFDAVLTRLSPTISNVTEELTEAEKQYRFNTAVAHDYREASLEYEVTADMVKKAEEDRAKAHDEAAAAMEEAAAREEHLTALTADFFNQVSANAELLTEYSGIVDNAAGRDEALNQRIFEQIQAHSDNASAIAIAGEALGIYSEEQADAMLKAALLDEAIRRQVESWDGTKEGIDRVREGILEYIDVLNGIPSTISTTVTTNYVSQGEPPSYVGAGGKGQPGGADSEFAMGGWTGGSGGIVHPNELVVPSGVLMGGMDAIGAFAQKNVPGGVAGGNSVTIQSGAITVMQQPGQSGQQLAEELMYEIGRQARQQSVGRG